VTWRLERAAITLAVVVVTSIILKFSWYDHLKELEHINQFSSPAAPELNSVSN
jgi:uncharacterized protein (DUF486 family)